jgi:hypothetical protein
MFFIACCSWGSVCVMIQLLEADLMVVADILSIIATQLLSNLFIYLFIIIIIAFN